MWNGGCTITAAALTTHSQLLLKVNGVPESVYTGPDDGPDWKAVNKDRFRLLKDQLALYEEQKISWSIWLYKASGDSRYCEGNIVCTDALGIRTSVSKVCPCSRVQKSITHGNASGMVYASSNTAYMKLLGPFLQKKKQLALDGWGSDSKRVASVFDPLEKWMVDNVGSQLIGRCSC